MKTTQTLSVALLIAIISTIGLNSVSAYGQGNGQGKNAQTNFVDTNNNGIADGQEDWDNDGILNKDDEDYEKSYTNMRDDDWDGIPNKDDEDYVRSQDGTNKPENAWNWNQSWNSSSMNMGQKQGSTNSVLKARYKNTYEAKYGSMIEKMDDTQLNALISKIDDISEKVNTGDYSDETKEKFNAMLDALREIATDNLDWEDDIIDSLFQ